MSVQMSDLGEFVHIDGVCYQRTGYVFGVPTPGIEEADVFPSCSDCQVGLLTGSGESLLTGGGEPLGV